MDNVHCNIIQDLLPLYADNVVSPESRDMVENHLAQCPACRNCLEEIRASIPQPQHTDKRVLKKLKRRERIKAIISSMLLIVWFYALIGSPIVAFARESFIDYGAEDCAVSVAADGTPLVTLSERARGGNIYYLYDLDEGGNTEVYIFIESNVQPFFYKFLTQLWRMDFSEDGTYVSITMGLSENCQNYSNFPGVKELLFDAQVSAIYYQPITWEQQNDFYDGCIVPYMTQNNTEPLLDYEIPDSDQRVLLWSSEE